MMWCAVTREGTRPRCLLLVDDGGLLYVKYCILVNCQPDEHRSVDSREGKKCMDSQVKSNQRCDLWDGFPQSQIRKKNMGICMVMHGHTHTKQSTLD
jgi:hypothetical protein